MFYLKDIKKSRRWWIVIAGLVVTTIGVIFSSKYISIVAPIVSTFLFLFTEKESKEFGGELSDKAKVSDNIKLKVWDKNGDIREKKE